MFHSGLVSVTFRKLSPREIVDLVAKAGLEGIEWGGDVHVPHGDRAVAREVRRMTEDAGLKVAAYGSYYRVGHGEPAPFDAVLETALALGAPTIRVWAGRKGSAAADQAYRDQVAVDSRRIAELAAERGVAVAYEFHGGTLTDTAASARTLLEAVKHDTLKSYWQPPGALSVPECLDALRSVRPWLSNIHAFWWVAGKRRSLTEGTDTWAAYLREAAATGRDHWVLLEFVQDDAPEAFAADAAALQRLLREGGVTA